MKKEGKFFVKKIILTPFFFFHTTCLLIEGYLFRALSSSPSEDLLKTVKWSFRLKPHVTLSVYFICFLPLMLVSKQISIGGTVVSRCGTYGQVRSTISQHCNQVAEFY